MVSAAFKFLILHNSWAGAFLQHCMRYRRRDDVAIITTNEQERRPICFLLVDLAVARAMKSRQSTLPKHMSGARDMVFVVDFLEFSLI